MTSSQTLSTFSARSSGSVSVPSRPLPNPVTLRRGTSHTCVSQTHRRLVAHPGLAGLKQIVCQRPQKPPSHLVCEFLFFFFSPAGITTVNVTSWHLDSARRFTAFLLLNRYMWGLGSLNFFEGGVSNISLKSCFRSHFYVKPVIFDPSSLFHVLRYSNRSSCHFFVSVSNSTANEGAIRPKGVPAAYMWTLNVVKTHF